MASFVPDRSDWGKIGSLNREIVPKIELNWRDHKSLPAADL